MPEIKSLEEAQEYGRKFVGNYESVFVDKDGGVYLNRSPKGLEGTIYQVHPEVKEISPVKIKTKKSDE